MSLTKSLNSLSFLWGADTYLSTIKVNYIIIITAFPFLTLPFKQSYTTINQTILSCQISNLLIVPLFEETYHLAQCKTFSMGKLVMGSTL